VNVTALDRVWATLWAGCPPVVPELRRRFRDLWIRFHTLPESKRYATTDAEHTEILRRHHVLLDSLLDDTIFPGDDALVAVTCSWSATSELSPRNSYLADTVPEATHWRSDDRATEPGFHSWQHHFVTRTALGDPTLDRLLLAVADDHTDGVILTDRALSWLYHPYDGGADIFASTGTREQLAANHSAWLPPPRSGT
jgi:hypothetical protein